jgi:hypothetical protein
VCVVVVVVISVVVELAVFRPSSPSSLYIVFNVVPHRSCGPGGEKPILLYFCEVAVVGALVTNTILDERAEELVFLLLAFLKLLRRLGWCDV